MALLLGAGLFFFLWLPAVLAVTAVLLWKFPTRKGGSAGSASRTPWYAYAVVSVAWFFSFLIFALLPADLAEAKHQRCEYVNAELDTTNPCTSPVMSPTVIMNMWRAVYWSVLPLGWVLLPFTRSYVTLGGFTVRAKLWRAARVNIIRLGILAAVLTLLGVWLAFGQGLSFDGVKGLAIGLNNAIGLFVLMILLGFGLAQVPRSLWNRGDVSRRLRHCEFKATELADRRDDAILAVSKVLGQLDVVEARLRRGEIRKGKALATAASAEGGDGGDAAAKEHAELRRLVGFAEQVRQLVPSASADDDDHRRSALRMPRPLRSVEVPNKIDEHFMAKMQRSLRENLFEYRRASYLWHVRCDQAFRLQDIVAWKSAVREGARPAAAAEAVREERYYSGYATVGASFMGGAGDDGDRDDDDAEAGGGDVGGIHGSGGGARVRAAGHGTPPVPAQRVVCDGASPHQASPLPATPRSWRVPGAEQAAEAAAHYVPQRYSTLTLYWQGYVQPSLLRIASVVAGALTVLTAFTELTMWTVILTPPLDLSALSYLIHVPGLSALAVQALAFLSMLYLGFVCYYSIFRFNVYKWYELVPGYVDPSTLCLNAAIMCRFFPPLCYNLVFLLHENYDAVVRLLDSSVPALADAPGYNPHDVPVTSFERLMGTMNVLPIFGVYFNYFFPCVLLVFMVGTMFRLWTRFMSCLGIPQFGFEDDDDASYEAMGRQLLARERRRREMQRLSDLESGAVAATASEGDGGAEAGFGDGGGSPWREASAPASPAAMRSMSTARGRRMYAHSEAAEAAAAVDGGVASRYARRSGGHGHTIDGRRRDEHESVRAAWAAAGASAEQRKKARAAAAAILAAAEDDNEDSDDRPNGESDGRGGSARREARHRRWRDGWGKAEEEEKEEEATTAASACTANRARSAVDADAHRDTSPSSPPSTRPSSDANAPSSALRSVARRRAHDAAARAATAPTLPPLRGAKPTIATDDQVDDQTLALPAAPTTIRPRSIGRMIRARMLRERAAAAGAAGATETLTGAADVGAGSAGCAAKLRASPSSLSTSTTSTTTMTTVAEESGRHATGAGAAPTPVDVVEEEEEAGGVNGTHAREQTVTPSSSSLSLSSGDAYRDKDADAHGDERARQVDDADADADETDGPRHRGDDGKKRRNKSRRQLAIESALVMADAYADSLQRTASASAAPSASASSAANRAARAHRQCPS